MAFLGDYHTHTIYSDGLATIERNIKYARAKGLKELCISDHSYRSIINWMTNGKCKRQRKKINKLESKYPDVKVFLGLEANIYSMDGTLDVKKEDISRFDFLLCGYHRLSYPKTFRDLKEMYGTAYFKNTKVSQEVIDRNTKTVITAIKNYPIAILTHINNLLQVNVKEVAKCCCDYGTMLELNSKHIDISKKDFEAMLATDVMIIANTDSHISKQVGNFSIVEQYLQDFPEAYSRIVNYDKLASPLLKRTST